MTLGQLTLGSFPKQTATRQDFHAKVSVLLENGGGSKTQEALYFLKSCGWLKPESLNTFSLKTSEGFFPMMEERLSEQSSALYGNWGTMRNGKCLTARTMGCHRTGRECSLSDILETEVDEKYFLSEKIAQAKMGLHYVNQPKYGKCEISNTCQSLRVGGDVLFVRTTTDGFHLARNDLKKSSIQGTHVTFPGGKSHCLSPNHIPKTIEKNPQSGRVYSMDGVSPCLAPSSPKGTAEMPKIITIGNLYPSGGQNGAVYDSQGLSPTLRSGQGVKGRGIGSCNAPKVCDHNHDGLRIRKLTPLECWRLQGFPDWTFHKARDAGISDSQLYRQAGNAVTVNVVYEIARRFKEAN